MFKFLGVGVTLLLCSAVYFQKSAACDKADACVSSGVASEVGLEAHNAKRESQGIRPLALSPELSSSAAQCALYYCSYENAPSCPSKDASVGENRLMLTSQESPESGTEIVADAWSNFWEGYPLIAITTKGGLQDIVLQRYAQLMWRDASLVGFAVCNCSSGYQSVVAHYDQAPDFIRNNNNNNNGDCSAQTSASTASFEETTAKAVFEATTTTATAAPTTTTTAATTEAYHGYQTHSCSTPSADPLNSHRKEAGVTTELSSSQKLVDSADKCNDFYCTLTNHKTWSPTACPYTNGAAQSVSIESRINVLDGSDFDATGQLKDVADKWNSLGAGNAEYENMISSDFTQVGVRACICGTSKITVAHYA